MVTWALAAAGGLPLSVAVVDVGQRRADVQQFEVGAVVDCAPTAVRAQRVREERCTVRELDVALSGVAGREGEVLAAVGAELATLIVGRDVIVARSRAGAMRAIALDPATAPTGFRERENLVIAEALLSRAIAALDVRPPPDDALARPWSQLTDMALRVPPLFGELGSTTVAHRAVTEGEALAIESFGMGRFVDPAASANACYTDLEGVWRWDAGGLATRSLDLTGRFVIPMQQEVSFAQRMAARRVDDGDVVGALAAVRQDVARE